MEHDLQTEVTNKQNIANSNARKITKSDSLSYYANFISSVRDLNSFGQITGLLPQVQELKFDSVQQAAVAAIGGGGNNGDCYYLPVCNGISFPLQAGWSCDVLPPKDAYNNIISAFGKYGTDIRQQYYVQYPSNKNINSPIVVLVHGGAWFSGPNPDNVQGWGGGFTTNAPDNFVKNLLDNGFVVVTTLYRLSRLGITDAEMNSNPIILQDQINDIDAAIVHVRTNFPSCLGLNANSIQVLGESAGAHLALMWAYTKTTIPSTYIKSVIGMYAPTNMQQYGNFLKNIPSNQNFTCGGMFIGFPWYFPIVDITNPNEVYNTTNFDCKAAGYPNSRVAQSYKMIQSLVGTAPINAPLSSNELLNASPFNALNSNRVIPTFIMHGKSDVLVPYNQATLNMDTRLAIANNGGLLFNFTSSTGNVPTTYAPTPRHGIKQYDNANHGFLTTDTNILTSSFSQTVLYLLIRLDAIKWLNGHK
ncbi:MAG: alpha/beta hydrolase [Chitinophagales bacterium]|nr:alpha/beta hydrolase [Chitinophagales bacterium]